MTTHISCPPGQPPAPDLAAIKKRQQVTWSAGDYAAVGITIQIVSESLCEAVDLHAGRRVLDVATGHGNTALAAARRNADVIGVDYVPSLLQRGRERAAADRLKVEFRDGDCEALPFKDGEFDYVLSTFGVMFAPDHVRSASELLRVCKPGGKIGLANWTPEGLIGQMFKLMGSFVPPPAGIVSPLAWGTKQHLDELFGASAKSIQITRKEFVFRYRSAEHWLEVFRTYYGPTFKAYETLAPAQQVELSKALVAFMQGANRSGDASLAVPSEYVEVVITRSR
jgi:ubiquinone/menaquinone biosynthesis C-methylase UbiE